MRQGSDFGLRASVIVPIYNGKCYLARCLLSFNHQILKSDESFEVIVVDDGSTDGTGEMVETLVLRYPLHYVYKERSARSSRSAARNLGVMQASGEVLIFVDGDHIVSPTFVSEHLRAHRVRTDLAVIGHRSYLAKGEVSLKQLETRFALSDLPPVEQRDERDEVIAHYSENINNTFTPWFLFWTSNVSVRLEHVKRVGGFDETFIAWGLEDQEYGYRLHKHGLVFVYNQKTIVYHQHHPKDHCSRLAGWAVNYQLLKDKYPDLEIMLVEAMGWLRVRKRDELSWLAAYRRFDEAVRVLVGQERQSIVRGVVIRLDDAGKHHFVERLEQAIHQGPVVVFDHSSVEWMDIWIQSVRSAYDLFYYRHPSIEKQNEVLEACLPRWGMTRSKEPAYIRL